MTSREPFGRMPITAKTGSVCMTHPKNAKKKPLERAESPLLYARSPPSSNKFRYRRRPCDRQLFIDPMTASNRLPESNFPDRHAAPSRQWFDVSPKGKRDRIRGEMVGTHSPNLF